MRNDVAFKPQTNTLAGAAPKPSLHCSISFKSQTLMIYKVKVTLMSSSRIVPIFLHLHINYSAHSF